MENAQERETVLGLIRKHNEGPASLLEVLNVLQEEHGYLPQNVQELVASEMGIPFSRVFEVSSFYARFTTEKLGEYAIRVCMGTACYVLGADKVVKAFADQLGVAEGETTPDGKFSLIACRCIGACGLAPVLTVNTDVHAKIYAEDVAGVLAQY